MKGLILILCLFSADSLADRGLDNGLFTDMAKVFGTIGKTFDNIQARAGKEVEEEIIPFFKTADEKINGAVDKIKDKFHSISESVGKVVSNTFDTIGEGDDQVVIGGKDQAKEEEEETSIFRFPRLRGQFENFNPFKIFRQGSNWWDGPNVCIERQVVDDENATSESPEFFINFDSTFKSCSNGPNYYQCRTVERMGDRQRTEIVRYQCCYGHVRTENPKEGCVKVDMNTLRDTVEGLEANEFLMLVDSLDLGDIFDGNKTVFVPSDDAVEEFSRDFQKFSKVVVTENDNGVTYSVDDGEVGRYKRMAEVVESQVMEEIIKGHFVEGFVTSHDIRDEQMMETVTGKKLRLTVYSTFPEKTLMANCAKVIFKDYFATNGVTHVVNKVILPAEKTIGEILSNDMQLRTLKKALDKAGLLEDLNKAQGQHTLFAPTDDAFAKLDQVIREKIMKGDGCAKDILRHHIANNVICSGVIDDKAKTLNSVAKYLFLDIDTDGRFYVENAMVVTRDVMALNGVIHIVEDVLIPESAKSIMQVVEDEGKEHLKEALEDANLADGLDDMANVTLFAPSETALLEYAGKPDFLMFHMASPKICRCEMRNNALLKSGVPGKNIRINVYRNTDQVGPFGLMRVQGDVVTAQCARVSMEEHEVCGGMIQTVGRLMAPSKDDVITILKTEEKYQKFYELIKFSGVEEEIKEMFDKVDKLVTIFAPVNTAFRDLQVEQIDKLFGNKDVAMQTVKRHIIKGMICCAGIPSRNPFMDMTLRRTLDRHILSVRRRRGRYFIGEAEITECDFVAENGVVHTIDQVLLPKAVHPRSSGAIDRVLRIMTDF